jgi:hypothetical protein
MCRHVLCWYLPWAARRHYKVHLLISSTDLTKMRGTCLHLLHNECTLMISPYLWWPQSQLAVSSASLYLLCRSDYRSLLPILLGTVDRACWLLIQ